MNPTRFLFRAAGPADIDAFERAAADSVIGITTLPADRARLAERLERSAAAFASGSHFSNAYRARFGRTPRDERSQRAAAWRDLAAPAALTDGDNA